MSFLHNKWVTRGALGIFVLGITIGLFFLIDSQTSWLSQDGDYASEPDSIPHVEREIILPVFMHGMVVNNLSVVEDEVKKNQRFTDLLEGYYVSPSVKQQLNLLPRSVYDFRKISAHKKYTLLVEHDSIKTIKALVYEPNPIDYVVFHLKDSLLVEACQRKVDTLQRSISGRIESTLSHTIEAMNISHDLTNKFVDIFAWQVDFQRLQKGDQFKLIYEENIVEEKPVGIGRILGVYFEHSGNGYYAFPFDQGNGPDYFDEAGNSLRKALLKYPIEFTRISSRYSQNRFHPVVKVFRPHLGTDFAAPTGTPIRSVGDGIVEEAQYKTNNGNYVKIRHNGTYTTGYLHMSKIASGITPGTRVRQGQTIGYVGSTGLATGPHLCYRFWKNGVQVDALRVELPPSQPIDANFFPAFEQVKTELIKQLQLIPFPAREEQPEVAMR
ncbi:MAG TPA: peptidoglycan DD-metalloendopeptidase family protein [Cyclobacteriaceae bacterium]|nr:peptidoglycan DD-metalloendopeptidase family protein [Cyclobacteriaceae bacterium]